MRALVVGNSTLATMYENELYCTAREAADAFTLPSAVQYRLPEHLRLHIAQSVTLKASTHVQGTGGRDHARAHAYTLILE